jgi:hypothetical protein
VFLCPISDDLSRKEGWNNFFVGIVPLFDPKNGITPGDNEPLLGRYDGQLLMNYP